MFLSDHQIAKRCEGDKPMIEPFVGSQIKGRASLPNGFEGKAEVYKMISYGLSSYGYDARLDNTFLVPKFDYGVNPVVDPKNISVKDYEQINRDIIEIPPHSFVLGQTMEYFRIPRDVLVFCLNKSTYARCGAIVNVTPLEPEWEGTVTIEISNTNVKPVRIYAGEGIAQFVFGWCDPKIKYSHEGLAYLENNNCQTSYADRKGKYQGQREVTPPKL
jgi:dCTP deaminase